MYAPCKSTLINQKTATNPRTPSETDTDLKKQLQEINIHQTTNHHPTPTGGATTKADTGTTTKKHGALAALPGARITDNLRHLETPTHGGENLPMHRNRVKLKSSTAGADPPGGGTGAGVNQQYPQALQLQVNK